MEAKNELNDIILNKPSAVNNNKKIILAVGTLGVILIIVVMLMSSLSSSSNNNLPQPLAPEPVAEEAFLEPEPTSSVVSSDVQEPLFEEVEVINEEPAYNDNLDEIAQKLKQESLVSEKKESYQAPITPTKVVVQEVAQPKIEAKPVIKEQPKTNYVHTLTPTPSTPKKVVSGKYYLQVGSFTTYEPNQKFLKSITDKGFSYTYHKVIVNSQTINKVLVGPFGTEKDARNALRSVRSSIEPGAFLTKI